MLMKIGPGTYTFNLYSEFYHNPLISNDYENKLGLSCAKLSSRWDWTLLGFSVNFVSSKICCKSGF